MDETATATADLPPFGAEHALVFELLDRGGIAIWAIGALSILTVAIVLWKIWQLSALGAFRRARAEDALAAWARGEDARARELAEAGSGASAQVVATAIRAHGTPGLAPADARAETTRVAKRLLGEAQSGLRALEFIATIAPLLGLLGTVLGMISAFQALEAMGGSADPSSLAGGIWEALLTTAAGMAVAIPASAALAWLEGVIDRLRRDLEDMATRVFTRADAAAPRATAAMPSPEPAAVTAP
ncbi:MAG: MotA/TolQ/ExbB proton channel family protein [Paracoccaceae bacterium]